MNKLLFTGIVMTVFMIMMSSCQYKYIVEPVIPPPNPEEPILFSTQIESIWSEQNCVGCHNTGGQKPDLTVGNAYASITSLGLIDLTDASASTIYVHPSPDGSHYGKYTSSQAVLLLTWIEQGALDN